MKLDIFTFIAGDIADYAEFLKFTSERMSSGEHDLTWKCIESLNVSRLPNGFKCVGKSGGKNEHNSMKHAIAMHKALKHIENDFVLFIDADIAIVYKNWDKVIINNLKKYHCFGGAYPTGKDKITNSRYRNFPRVNFFAFRKDILKKVKLDFTPFKDKPRTVFRTKVSKKESKIVGLKEGSLFSHDVGWRLPFIFKQNNLSYNFMPCYLISSKHRKLLFLDKKNKNICLKNDRTMEEFHYKNKLFALHKKWSRHHKLNDKFGLAWKKRIELYMERMEEK
ncbi:MAG: glycosyltransferase family A protein [Candidatus Thorarchaeota archaeon]